VGGGGAVGVVGVECAVARGVQPPLLDQPGGMFEAFLGRVRKTID
jgi:hypothetical protein